MEAAPAAPEDQREDETDAADDHEDQTNGVEIEPTPRPAGVSDRDPEVEYGPDGDEEQAGADAHGVRSPCTCVRALSTHQRHPSVMTYLAPDARRRGHPAPAAV